VPRRLALHGGEPIQPSPLKPYISIGEEERAAVDGVMTTGRLSAFAACSDDRFYGGTLVRAFELEFAGMLGSPHAVSFNSASSGLVAAIGALGIGLGDEVIVPAQTMSASAAAILANNAAPVFADVEGLTYGLDPESVRSRISERTKALMIVHLYGHPARMTELLAIASEHRLTVIEDCAQAPLATFHGGLTGTFGDIGVFSFNVHKHANCGEGGIAVTRNPELYERMAMIRNHGEVHDSLSRSHSLVGWNWRLTELQAAIALEQTKKLKRLVERRRTLAGQLSSLLAEFPWITIPRVEENCEHSYYDFPMQFDLESLGLTKPEFMEMTAAEHLPISESYRPLYWQHIYQDKTVGKTRGFPFEQSLSAKNRDNYRIGSCPRAETFFNRTCLTFEICSYELDEQALSKIAQMFRDIEQYCLSVRQHA
jgi:perosamine synthetase